MGKKYVTQPVEVSLSWEADDSPDAAIVSCKIKYRKPDGTIGEWPGTYDEANRAVYYIGPSNSSYGQSVGWAFWPVVTLSDGRTFPGEPVFENIYEEGE